MESNGHESAFRRRYSTLMSFDPFGYFLTTPYGVFEVTEAYQSVLELIQDCDIVAICS